MLKPRSGSLPTSATHQEQLRAAGTFCCGKEGGPRRQSSAHKRLYRAWRRPGRSIRLSTKLLTSFCHPANLCCNPHACVNERWFHQRVPSAPYGINRIKSKGCSNKCQHPERGRYGQEVQGCPAGSRVMFTACSEQRRADSVETPFPNTRSSIIPGTTSARQKKNAGGRTVLGIKSMPERQSPDQRNEAQAPNFRHRGFAHKSKVFLIDFRKVLPTFGLVHSRSRKSKSIQG